jgi:K+-transporting ATPase ATPase C chain
MKKRLLTGSLFLLMATLLTGIIYPVVVTVFANLLFREKATGSLIRSNGLNIGSELIGQNFDSLKYFWSRPSSVEYNPMPSGGSNLGPLNPRLREEITKRRDSLILKNYLKPEHNIPSEMIFASGSGLDPHISPEAALQQLKRVAKERGYDPAMESNLAELIQNLTEGRQFFIFGEPRINVIQLNLMTDSLK